MAEGRISRAARRLFLYGGVDGFAQCLHAGAEARISVP
jgi:hypothetical protein